MMASATVAADNQQAQWDAEQVAAFRRRLKRLSQDVRRCQQEESDAKKKARSAAKRRKEADEELSVLIMSDSVLVEGDDAPTFLRRLQGVSLAAETAAEAAGDKRRAWVDAVAKRRLAQDELRVAVRKQFERLPLFDGPHAHVNGEANGNGHATEEEPTATPEPAAPEWTAEPPIKGGKRWRVCHRGQTVYTHRTRETAAEHVALIERAAPVTLATPDEDELADPQDLGMRWTIWSRLTHKPIPSGITARTSPQPQAKPARRRKAAQS